MARKSNVPFAFFRENFKSLSLLGKTHVLIQMVYLAKRDINIAKIWLKPVRLQSSGGLSPNEIRKILKLIEEYEDQILESWHEYFDE